MPDLLDKHDIAPIELSLDWVTVISDLLTGEIFPEDSEIRNEYLTEA